MLHTEKQEFTVVSKKRERSWENSMLKTLILSILGLSYMIQANDPEFVILITSYKNQKWAADNLKSACHQKSTKPYQVICINDCSPDRTGEIMDAYVKEHNLQDRVTVIHNKERVGALANIYNAVHSLEDHKIVVSLDGDDLLANNDVLLRLEEEYRDPDVWLTYGSSTTFPVKNIFVGDRLPDDIFFKGKIRTYRWVTSHLRTFKAGLFKKINKEDLMYNGRFFEMTWDQAFMLPMLEMAGPTKKNPKIRSRYIKDILYNYRMDNPISDHKKDVTFQKSLAKHIRALKPYEPIEHFS